MIVLPMAGLSSRFFKAGYDIPKYMLDLHGKSTFLHALNSFKAFFGREKILIVCRADYETPDFVRRECRKAGLSETDVQLVVLDHETAGQAETVSLGLECADADPTEPLTIFNIDTFRPGFAHPTAYDLSGIDGYVEVFRGPGTHWSFVRPDLSDPAAFRAAEVAEKSRISDLCSTGLYYFRDIALFKRLYAPIAGKDPATLQGGERYIAPLYNDAIGLGLDIRYALIDAADVQFCGTPAEYDALRATPAP
jgi:hypothetical protein